jgi:hypothetical protein
VNDVDELRNLLQRYARAADGRDVDTLSTLFHPDAVISGTRGELTLEAWLDTMRAPRAFPVSMHVLGDPLVALAAGGEQGTLDTYAVVYQLGDHGAGQDDLTLGIRYVDDVVRFQGRWVIQRRRAETVWMR